MAQPLIAQSLIATATTRGGISFDQLCRGDQSYYVCDKECLVHDISNEDTLQEVEDKLVKKIDENFQMIQISRDAQINKFYIGKTFVQIASINGHRTLNPTEPKTWKRKGISSRWGDHKKEEYGKDGMVVIAVITKDEVPLHQNGDRVIGQEHYTLALEQRLLHYYKITRRDTRLDNETFTSGGTDKKGSAAYALYVAFSLEPEANEDNSCIQNETREDESVEIDPNESNQVMDTDNLQHTSLVRPPSTVSLPQSTVSIAQSTSNMVDDWLATLEDSNECLEGKQRDNSESRLALTQQETPQNITDDTEIQNGHGENHDGIETIPEARLNPLMNRKRKHVDTSTTADDLGEIVKPLTIPIEKMNVSGKNKSIVTFFSSELQRGQMKLGHVSTEKAKGKEQGMEVDTSQQKRIRIVEDKNCCVKRPYNCSYCYKPGHRKPKCPELLSCISAMAAIMKKTKLSLH